MSLHVTPIGVNDAFSLTGYNTNYLVETNGKCFLVDCGTTCARALAARDIKLTDIEHLFISHLHLDHVGGLVELGIKRYVQKMPRPTVYLHQSLYPSIWNEFLSGLMGAYIDLNGTPQEARAETFFEFVLLEQSIETTQEPDSIQGVDVRTVPVHHIEGMSSHGLILDDKVFLTTDTTYNPEQLDRMANRFAIDTIFHDCSFTESNKQVHTAFDELQQLPRDLREMLVLTHYEDHVTQDKAGELALGVAGKTYQF